MRKRLCSHVAALLLPVMLVSCGRLDNAVQVIPVTEAVFQPLVENDLPDEWTIDLSDGAVPDRQMTDEPEEETETEAIPETESSEEPETDAPAVIPSEETEKSVPEITAVTTAPAAETPPAQTTAQKPSTAAKPQVTTEAKTEPYEAIPPAVSDHRSTVIINTSSGKYHLYASCSGVKSMNEANKLTREVDSLSQLDDAGYKLCSICEKKRNTEQEAAAAAAAAAAVVTDPPAEVTVPSREALSEPEETPEEPTDSGGMFDFEGTVDIVLNTNSKKIHLDPACRYVSTMKETNRQDLTVTAEELNDLVASGYDLCKGCGGS